MNFLVQIKSEKQIGWLQQVLKNTQLDLTPQEIQQRDQLKQAQIKGMYASALKLEDVKHDPTFAFLFKNKS